jgi:uracil-DNA glycosylase
MQMISKISKKSAKKKSGARDAADLIPPGATLKRVREAAAGCKCCDLWKTGTQTVFGEGKRNSKVMFVGEIPGDKEDLIGRPFVGPAGKLLDQALEAAGIDREDIYVTNVVKHFKWEPRGKRRLHKKPRASEIKACRPWLDAEFSLVKPQIVVCLGATAAQALLGKTFSVTRSRGKLVDSELAPYVLATIHPSALLRLPEGSDRHAEMEHFIQDLRDIVSYLK